MNACLYCEARLPAFTAFCDSTCAGLFGVAETNGCPTCQADLRVTEFTPAGRPILGCAECGESFEVVAPEVA
ncbi:MAG TPA: hypothetical protein VFH78_13680 [Candidatus Thermoplasmatota archaeon]|nr:hypothetical protein [Candidatus Thermoplasmatota archaeon]